VNHCAVNVRGRQKVEKVLIHVGADELTAPAREARIVKLFEEGHNTWRND